MVSETPAVFSIHFFGGKKVDARPARTIIRKQEQATFMQVESRDDWFNG